jgi:hypothetical protein
MSFTLLGILQSQAAGGAVGGGYDFLESITLSSSGSIDFTGLDSYSGYNHFQIRGTIRGPGGSITTSPALRVNNDSGNNYSWHYMRTGKFGGTTENTSGAASSSSYVFLGTAYDGGATANLFSPIVIDIADALSNSKNKTLRYFSGFDERIIGATPPYARVHFGSAAWYNTNPVTTISILSAAAGSRFSLYGRA